VEKVRLCGVSVLVGGSVRVTWVDGADDGESQGDHEGAGGALPLGVALVSATCSSTKSDSLARCARAITGTSPTADTKLPSSNLLEIVCGAWESST